MNENYEKNLINQYEGNGWSKYQVMVLQQLADHNTVLQNLNKEIANIKQTIAVSETELKMWKIQITSSIENIQEEIEYILYDENGISKKISDIQRTLDVEEQANTKTKATWALYGSIAMFIVNIIVQVLVIFLKT